MQIVRKETEPLNLTIDITLEPSDYLPKLDSEIKKYKNKAQLKGFRKGKTPDSVIKKLHGKAILAEVVNETLQESLFSYLDTEKIHYLGQPLADHEYSADLHLDINKTPNYSFRFDVGVAPDIELQGVSEENSYTYYDVEIDENLVNDEINAARKRFGTRIQATDTIQLMDMVQLEAEELDGDQIKDNGWKTTITILVDVIDDQDVKNDLLTKKMGDTIRFDAFKLEDKDADYIRKYILKVPAANDQEIGNMFQAQIIEVSRIELAEMNEAFFSNFGNEEIVDEATLKQFFKDDLKKFYDHQATQFMYRDIMDYLIVNNKVDLPEAFLKRYLKATTENLTDEILEKEFDAFADNMRWSLQKSHLAKKYSLAATEEDIRMHFTQSVFSYMRNMGNLDHSFINRTVDQLMKNKEQVNKAYEEIISEKILSHVATIVQKNRVNISQKDFTQKIEELNKRVNNLT
jgi:trigger factor